MMGVEGEEPQGQEKDMVEVVAEVVAMVGLRRGEGAEEVSALHVQGVGPQDGRVCGEHARGVCLDQGRDGPGGDQAREEGEARGGAELREEGRALDAGAAPVLCQPAQADVQGPVALSEERYGGVANEGGRGGCKGAEAFVPLGGGNPAGVGGHACALHALKGVLPVTIHPQFTRCLGEDEGALGCVQLAHQGSEPVERADCVIHWAHEPDVIAIR